MRRLLAAAALIALAVLALLLAADVRSWRGRRPRTETPRPRTYLGGVAGSLLGTGDDVTFRRALQLYEVAAATHLRLDNATQVQTTRAAAQDALAAAAGSGDTAAGFAGANAARHPRLPLEPRPGGEQDQVDSAIADFTDAIRADAGNDDAKFDLELLLRLSAASGTRPGRASAAASVAAGAAAPAAATPGKRVLTVLGRTLDTALTARRHCRHTGTVRRRRRAPGLRRADTVRRVLGLPHPPPHRVARARRARRSVRRAARR